MNADKLLPESDVTAAHILRAGKIVAAYYRQLWRLLEPPGGVELLARIEREASQPPRGVYEDDDEGEDDDDGWLV